MSRPEVGDRSLLPIGALGVFALSLLTAVGIRRPLILPDESGHILNALQLRTGSAPNGLGYYHGYSAVLAPFIDEQMSLSSLMLRVQVINAVLAAATFLLLVRLGARLRPDADRRQVLAGALFVSAYPASRLFGALALSENLLIPSVLLCLVLLIEAMESPTLTRLAMLVATSGLTASIHPRSVLLPASIAVVWALLAERHRIVTATSVVALSASVIAVQSSLLASSGITDVDSASRDTLSGILQANLSLEALITLPFTALGQVFYLTAATFGVVIVGLTSLARQARHQPAPDRDRSRPALVAALFCGVLLSSSLGLSALFLNQTTGDQAIYGRYLEGVFAPVLLIGILEFLKPTGPARQLLRSPLIVLALAAVVLLAARGADTFDGRQQLVNIAGVFPTVRALGEIALSAVLLFATTGALVAQFIAQRSRAAGVGFLALVFIAISISNVFVARAAIEALTPAPTMTTTVSAATEALDTSCVALDQHLLNDRWHQENLRLELRELTFEYWNSQDGEAPCSPLAVGGDAQLSEIGLLLEVQPEAQQALWVLDVASAEALRSRGLPSGSQPLQALPTSQIIDLEINVESSGLVRPGEEVTGRLTLHNHGPADLVPTGSFVQDVGTVGIGLDWRPTARSERSFEPSRIRFDQIVSAGESVTVEFVIAATDETGPLYPGTHHLTAEVVQEGVQWTGLTGSLPLVVGWSAQVE